MFAKFLCKKTFNLYTNATCKCFQGLTEIYIYQMYHSINISARYFGNDIGIQPSLNIIETQRIRHGRKYWI